MMLESGELGSLAASGATGSLSNIRGGAPLPPPAFLLSSLLPLIGEIMELQGVSSVLAMDTSRIGKSENCALGEERDRHLMSAECVILHARAGESCAGCCSHPQGEFGGPRQLPVPVVAVHYLLPLLFLSPQISSALSPSFHPIPVFFLSNNKGSPEQISALWDRSSQFSVLLRCLALGFMR